MASVADIIHQRHGDIMESWLREARAAASARGLSKVALENIMGSYLESLADQIETGHHDATDKRHEYVQNHIGTRLRQGFELAEILSEFVLLGRCITRMWWALPEPEWPPASDTERLHVQIQVAMADVTDTFHRHMLEDEQSDKRYGRMLQAIAASSLHDEVPLRKRLRELLDLVMEAMRAQCAAFLMYDVEESKLVLEACTGIEALEPYATSLDPKAFVADVAAHDEPVAIYDVGGTAKEVPSALRGSGIHSLLGIRVPPHHTLLGVLYVGLTAARPFSPREINRMTLLGERLSLHLENARLFSNLRDKVRSLDEEKILREQFVSVLAHDLRGPLGAARLAAELLASEPGRIDLAVRVQRNIDRVDRMVRDLLDANRIRAGETLPLRLDSCDLCAIAGQVVEEARMLHGDRFVLTCDVPMRGTWSGEDLRRAVWNLVTNAVKYGAQRGPIKIAVSRDEHFARVSVHNSGPPITAEEQKTIFNPYARTRSARVGGHGGWGLGLTLVHGVAQAHGGHVELSSSAEAGTTFTIEIPFEVPARPTNHVDATVH